MNIKRAPFLIVVIFAIAVAVILVAYFYFKKESDISTAPKVIHKNGVVDGIHLSTGLKDGEGLMTVITHCTACHSADLVIQNRMTKERWNATIRWMQETQNLWDLGDNQRVIVDYLVTNYPVIKKGRRENLSDIQWYELEN